ncbi:thioredoxin reductase [Thermococci archaeon]|nr:MAG: thioredoxin reductase [Thermococci archaeon]
MILNEEAREFLKKKFSKMRREVPIYVFFKKGVNDKYNEFCIQLMKELSEVTPKIRVEVHEIGGELSKRYKVDRSPTVLIDPERYWIRFIGAPAGEEGRSLIETILRVSKDDSGLSQESRRILSELKEERHVMVFVTPACPYCPGQVLNAFSCAIENRKVKAECIESEENIDLAEEYGVGAVPHTVVNGVTTSIGLQPEDEFVRDLLHLRPYHEHREVIEEREEEEEIIETDLLIIGAGPAGLTAAIYASRAGMNPIVIEKEVVGGLVKLTPSIENYPGFERIAGKSLVELMRRQAEKYAHIHENEEAIEIKVGKKIEVVTTRGIYLANAVIAAMGTRPKKLGVRGEEEYYGKGVSYCATCDGYLYKGKRAIVVGGGNTALTDALYLKSIGVDVKIVHRRNEFRAEKYLRDAIQREEIPQMMSSVIKEIRGDGRRVKEVLVENLETGERREIKTEAVFIAIGHEPNSEILREIGVKCDEKGFVIVDNRQRTNIPRIYAAGDITGGVMQIATAVAEGAVAAITSFEDTYKPYWREWGE